MPFVNVSFLSDDTKARELLSDGTYRHVQGTKGISAQARFMEEAENAPKAKEKPAPKAKEKLAAETKEKPVPKATEKNGLWQRIRTFFHH